jgi:hypothetical protein
MVTSKSPEHHPSTLTKLIEIKYTSACARETPPAQIVPSLPGIPHFHLKSIAFKLHQTDKYTVIVHTSLILKKGMGGWKKAKSESGSWA